VARFLQTSFRDMSSWHGPAHWLAIVLALAGAALLCRRAGGFEVTLTVASFVVPIVALLGARADSHVSPETRHLIFLLPFVQLFVATAIVRLAALTRRAAPLVAVAAVAVLVSGSLNSSRARTPDLFDGDSAGRIVDRGLAAEWLAGHASPSALLMGYEPLFYEAWKRSSSFSAFVVARADSAVAAKQLQRYCGRFAGAAFIFDRQNGYRPDLTAGQAAALTRKLTASGFVAQRFGDFVVALSTKPEGDPAGYIDDVIPLLQIAQDADVDNGKLELTTLRNAQPLLPARPC
jgi:hypothetical protein